MNSSRLSRLSAVRKVSIKRLITNLIMGPRFNCLPSWSDSNAIFDAANTRLEP